MIHTTQLEMYISSKYEDNGKLKECGNGRCLLCNKPIKDTDRVKYVHLLTNGDLVDSKEDFDNSQGFFPVGNGCKNKLRRSFLF